MEDKKMNCWMEEGKRTKKTKQTFIDADYFGDNRSSSGMWEKADFF